MERVQIRVEDAIVYLPAAYPQQAIEVQRAYWKVRFQGEPSVSTLLPTGAKVCFYKTHTRVAACLQGYAYDGTDVQRVRALLESKRRA